MINPRRLTATYKRVNDPRFAGGRYYQPFLHKRTCRTFRRASEALAYVERLQARWIRLYDVAMIISREVAQ